MVWQHVLGALCLATLCASGQLVCKITETLGCYTDVRASVLSGPSMQRDDRDPMSPELCAARCAALGLELSACYCGDGFAAGSARVDTSQCRGARCTADSSRWCGAAGRMLVGRHSCAGQRVPTGHACLDPLSRKLPFCDPSLPLAARISDLVSRLTLSEKAGKDTCAFVDHGVGRLGVPAYMHLVETNTAVASACVAQGKCATTFAAPAMLAASFNRSLWRAKGAVVSDEMRAMNNIGWHRTVPPLGEMKIGLEGYGPNMNLVRDPRFGRNCEIPSEDPLLTGSYASEYVRGLQDGPDPRYKKMIAGLKHFAAYSVEKDREAFNAVVSTFDLWDSYLPHYRMAFVEAGALMVMCSYNEINGVPACANARTLHDVLRVRWGLADVLVGSDCGAVNDMMQSYAFADNASDAAAKSIAAGLDQELGTTFFTRGGGIEQAVASGALSERAVDESVRRALHKRFVTGQFDPIEGQEYTTYGLERIAAPASQQTNLEGVLQGLVLLKNSGPVLPLARGSRVAVVGPHAVSRAGLLEDYAGDQQCYGGGHDCIPTIGEWMTRLNVGGTTLVAKGVDINSTDQSGISDAVDAVLASDVVVLCVGLDTTMEREGLDREDLGLPGLQLPFAHKVLSAAGPAVPVVLLVVSGGAVAVEDVETAAAAVVQAFYPATRGAEGIARTLFGLESRLGKLPVSVYARAFADELRMADFAVATGVGRTYRYYTGAPLWAFGTGLTYAPFSMNCSSSSARLPATIACAVTNEGGRAGLAGDEVVQLYHRAGADVRARAGHPVPLRQLRAFERVGPVAPGASASVAFRVTRADAMLTGAGGDPVLVAGTHAFEVWRGQGEPAVFEFAL
eukprot:m51a1_g6206 hypothetical protein (850) ;mRNA; f:140331-144109